jgi:hypothetical protein
MTSTEPPEGEETAGIAQPPIPGFQLPPREGEPVEQGDAVLFIPEGYTEGDSLDVAVWTLNAKTMGLVIMRRC